MGALVHSQITLEGGAAAKTATFNTPDLVNYDGRGIELTLDITAASGTTPTLDVKIQGKDEVSDTYTDIPGAAFTQKTAAGDDKLPAQERSERSARSVGRRRVLRSRWRATF
jgi:hypothetical protein